MKELMNKYIINNVMHDMDYNEALKHAASIGQDLVYFIDDNLELFTINVNTGLTETKGMLRLKAGYSDGGFYHSLLNETILLD